MRCDVTEKPLELLKGAPSNIRGRLGAGEGSTDFVKLRPVKDALVIRFLLGRQTMKSYFR